MIRPWGFVQDYFSCCGLRDRIHNKLENALPVIPFIDDSEESLLPSFSQEISREEYKKLRKRVRALEVFLEEYVVDVNCLEKSKK